MIKQIFHIENYWKVIVFYNIDCDLFHTVYQELEQLGVEHAIIQDIYQQLKSKQAQGVTCSDTEKEESIVLLAKHHSKKDYIDTIVHEAEHVKQAVLSAYHIKDKGEPPAYTLGYIVGKMYHVFGKIVCHCHSLL